MPEVENIIRAIAHRHHLTVADIKGKSHAPRITLPRQIAMFLARELTGCTFVRIGEIFRKHHTTAMHAHQIIGKRFGLAKVLAMNEIKPDALIVMDFGPLRDAAIVAAAQKVLQHAA